MPPKDILAILRRGVVIPAHPLALTGRGKFDETSQRRLTRYYCHAGAGGVAVAVHTTQFAIREPKHGLFDPVVELASQAVDECRSELRRPIVKIGGICGETRQAVREAETLRRHGYDIALLSLAGVKANALHEQMAHCKAVASVMPLMGFYLQPAVGGRVLPVAFWRRFVEIENVVAVKIAPFNRYQTLDVVRAVAEGAREKEIALYTGNDDNIVIDLLTTYRIRVGRKIARLRIVGGLLGHWACWTRAAVHLLEECHHIVDTGEPIPTELLTRAVEVTDSNAAFFDAANGFRGCIAGIHEILVRQGLMKSRRCLDPREVLSPGQKEEIDRVYAAYPHLNDDAFVGRFLAAEAIRARRGI